MTRVSPVLLRLAVAANAAKCPLPDHHRTAYATLAYGSKLLTQGELWFVESVLRLSVISERQRARLNEIAVKVERLRP